MFCFLDRIRPKKSLWEGNNNVAASHSFLEPATLHPVLENVTKTIMLDKVATIKMMASSPVRSLYDELPR